MIVVAGANGNLGVRVTGALRSRGTPVRALVRSRARSVAAGIPAAEIVESDFSDADTLARSLDGAAGVVSCLGASVAPRLCKGRRGYMNVDLPLNAALITAARRAGVGTFVYVSACGAANLRQLAYFQAHAAVEELLRASPLGWSIVRPTGLFSAFSSLHRLAGRGVVPIIGDGGAKTNPIDDADAATACIDALNLPCIERDIGGPDVLSRWEIASLALAAHSRTRGVRSIPPRLLAAQAAAIRQLNPRMSDLLRFVGHVMTHDTVAPHVGSRRLTDFFTTLSSPSGPKRSPSGT